MLRILKEYANTSKSTCIHNSFSTNWGHVTVVLQGRDVYGNHTYIADKISFRETVIMIKIRLSSECGGAGSCSGAKAYSNNIPLPLILRGIQLYVVEVWTVLN